MASWGDLPDFELGELWLRPRFSAVDRGEVESVRLKVDVHVVRKDAQVGPFFFLTAERRNRRAASSFPRYQSRFFPH